MKESSFSLGPDEKLVPIMIYTHQRLIWGKLIVKQMIRVSTLLQTEMAPKCMNLADVQVILFGAGSESISLKFPSLHVENDQIIAFHLLPPADSIRPAMAGPLGGVARPDAISVYRGRDNAGGLARPPGDRGAHAGVLRHHGGIAQRYA